MTTNTLHKVAPAVAKQTYDSFPKAAVAPWPVRGLKDNLGDVIKILARDWASGLSGSAFKGLSGRYDD